MLLILIMPVCVHGEIEEDRVEMVYCQYSTIDEKAALECRDGRGGRVQRPRDLTVLLVEQTNSPVDDPVHALAVNSTDWYGRTIFDPRTFDAARVSFVAIGHSC